nr:MAG TPA_asm: hypothetical protein [Caudoviricetes sp.]
MVQSGAFDWAPYGAQSDVSLQPCSCVGRSGQRHRRFMIMLCLISHHHKQVKSRRGRG